MVKRSKKKRPNAGAGAGNQKHSRAMHSHGAVKKPPVSPTPTVGSPVVIGGPAVVKQDLLEWRQALVADKQKARTARLLQVVNKKYRGVLKCKINGKWNKAFFCSFHRYCKLLFNDVMKYQYGDFIPVTEDDKKFLRGIIRSADAEPAFFVANALKLLGDIAYYIERDYELYFHYMKEAIITCDGASDKEKSVLLRCLPDKDNKRPVTVGDFLDTTRQLAKHAICDSRNKLYSTKWDRGIGVACVSAIPGDQCDCCGKAKQGTTGPMKVCERCKVTYYCKRDCQAKHWKDQHSKLCRKKGEFRVGDWVETRGPFGSVTPGGVCRIIARSSNCATGDFWIVSDEKRGTSTILSADKLRVCSLKVRGLDPFYSTLKFD
ncbi:expressed unknown protein [Seminavis robusta]|uniref:MYND-type domain-containing protein n=1 Tax=Seminavis robusta TaxID=568900 RepID=A0A9N8DTG3_9STRA|nr:expressed unknown protein [Seminavis robusta]|eukprot:Sro358_g125790.1 n/a (376) ;mRNA; r:15045-16172